jgi:hypothetical protein
MPRYLPHVGGAFGSHPAGGCSCSRRLVIHRGSRGAGRRSVRETAAALRASMGPPRPPVSEGDLPGGGRLHSRLLRLAAVSMPGCRARTVRARPWGIPCSAHRFGGLRRRRSGWHHFLVALRRHGLELSPLPGGATSAGRPGSICPARDLSRTSVTLIGRQAEAPMRPRLHVGCANRAPLGGLGRIVEYEHAIRRAIRPVRSGREEVSGRASSPGYGAVSTDAATAVAKPDSGATSGRAGTDRGGVPSGRRR